ncbi:hypothetical protein Tco_0933746 [Tanacetum coccineum]
MTPTVREGNMEMDPDIENMTISEYLECEAAKERRLWDDVQSRTSPTNYNEVDVDSFHRNKSKTFSYPYSYNLTPPHPWFLPVQPYPKTYLVSTNESNDVDLKNMTIAEYNLYVAKQGLGMNLLRAENIKRMGHDIVQDSIWEHDDDSEEDQEEDGDDGDIFYMWDITGYNSEETNFEVTSTRNYVTISAIEVLWEWRGIANMDFIKLGGSSRVLSDFLQRSMGAKTGCWLVLVLAGKLGKGFIQVGL